MTLAHVAAARSSKSAAEGEARIEGENRGGLSRRSLWLLDVASLLVLYAPLRWLRTVRAYCGGPRRVGSAPAAGEGGPGATEARHLLAISFANKKVISHLTATATIISPKDSPPIRGILMEPVCKDFRNSNKQSPNKGTP